MLGNSFCNAYDKGHLCFNRFLDTCGGQWRSVTLSMKILNILSTQREHGIQGDYLRDENRGRSCSRLFDSITYFGKHWLSQMCLSGFLWICTPNDIGTCAPSVPCPVPYLNKMNTVINGLLGMEAEHLSADARSNFEFLMTNLPCLPVNPWKRTLVSLFMRRFSAVAAYPEVAVE